jgi:hypothetical protein
MRHEAKRTWREIIAALRGAFLPQGNVAHEKIEAASPGWGEAASTIA